MIGTKLRRLHPFLLGLILGAILVYMSLFVLHGTNRRLAQDLNPLNEEIKQPPNHFFDSNKHLEKANLKYIGDSIRASDRVLKDTIIFENKADDKIEHPDSKILKHGVDHEPLNKRTVSFEASLSEMELNSIDDFSEHKQDSKGPYGNEMEVEKHQEDSKGKDEDVSKRTVAKDGQETHATHEKAEVSDNMVSALHIPSQTHIFGHPKGVLDKANGTEFVNFETSPKQVFELHGGQRHHSTVKLPTKTWRNDEFEKLNGVDLYVRNSYYDKRDDNGKKLIRTWALTPKVMTQDLYCHVIWIEKYGEAVFKVVKGFLRIQQSAVRPFCKYVTGVIECNWNETFVPKYVMISPSMTEAPNQWHTVRHINLPEKPPKKIGICLKTLFDHGGESLGPLMEWFELNKLLGVDKVIMYGYDNVSNDIRKLIEHYKSTGFLSLKSWNVPIDTYTKNIYKLKFTDPDMRALVKKTMTNESDIPCVRYHAQHLAYMDCIYDNMHKYSYLIFIDVDEYIIPETKKTLKELLTYIDGLDVYAKTASFVFEEACFSKVKPAVLKHNTRMTLLTQNYTRGPITSDHKAMKSVLRPSYIKNMHIHRVSGKQPSIWGYKSFHYIDNKLAKLHHYKNSGRCQPYNITDKATAKFQSRLVFAVTSLWERLYGKG